MLMHWLLKYEGYPPGVAVALLLHGLLLYILLPSQPDVAEMVRVERPAIMAVVAPENPQRARLQEQVTQQRQAEARQQEQQRQAEARRQEEQRQAEANRQAEARRQEEQRQAEATRQAEARRQEEQRQADARRQEEEQRQAEARRQEEQRLQAERQQREEAERQAAAAAAAAAEAAANAQNDLVSQYSAIIHDLISRNWNRPPNARNGMSVVLNLRLVPTGEVVSATIIKSSGDAAFDRSAEQAVARVGGFPELRDVPTPVFERNFRNFNLEFRPEDLLR